MALDEARLRNWPPRFTVRPEDAIGICVRMAACKPEKQDECIKALEETFLPLLSALAAADRLREAAMNTRLAYGDHWPTCWKVKNADPDGWVCHCGADALQEALSAYAQHRDGLPRWPDSAGRGF